MKNACRVVTDSRINEGYRYGASVAGLWLNVEEGGNVVTRKLAIIFGASAIAALLPSCSVAPKPGIRYVPSSAAYRPPAPVYAPASPVRPATNAARTAPQACSTAEFAGVRLQNQVRPSIVRLESNIGTATGFVVRHPSDGVLIVTNYHVIRSGSRFDAIFDSGARLGNVQVVKVDVDHDLALLQAPGIVQVAPGLELSAQGVVLAERVAAIGYPYVSGESEPSLTFEDGTVTSTRTELRGRTYIRTNANINPGNSGGPVIDACAQVVGIVVAVHTETQRTGLIIPVEELHNLLAANDAPRDKPQVEVASRIKALETAVRYKRGEDVAGMFSRRMLSERAMKTFVQSLKRSFEAAQSKVSAYLVMKANEGSPIVVEGRIITDYDALPQEVRKALLPELLSETEKEDVMLAGMLLDHKIDEHSAMIIWLGRFAHEMFGKEPTFRLDQVTVKTRSSLNTQVMIGVSASSRYWEFEWVYEWGDWRIDAFGCVRGCEAH